eukprot:TRINITY_DN4862_c0_g1_i3.p1 TRINITY_DN4862_c0_g1~~TRINITY_DN4862_c0_g1_i3.p1  ORF type:complete len:184 (+),score=0.53 TRINITY_DN4862_c0_g1_i3:60-611(+)
MGAVFSSFWRSLFGPRPVGGFWRILMLGLDAAGKTNILFKLRLGEVVTTIPTPGFYVETVEYKNIRFTIWDMGGQDKIRPLWHHYYQNTHAIIFVVDSNDHERIDVAAQELQHLLNTEELQNACLLVFANKQDLPSSLNAQQITERFGLNQLQQRTWHVQPCCAHTGIGLYEGLEWIANCLQG